MIDPVISPRTRMTGPDKVWHRWKSRPTRSHKAGGLSTLLITRRLVPLAGLSAEWKDRVISVNHSPNLINIAAPREASGAGWTSHYCGLAMCRTHVDRRPRDHPSAQAAPPGYGGLRGTAVAGLSAEWKDRVISVNHSPNLINIAAPHCRRPF
jgi:hypothetical protein